MGATRGAQQKGPCTHNSSNLVFCDLHSCSSSSSSRSSSSVKPPSRSRIVSIEEVAAYLIDQNMVHRRGAPYYRAAPGAAKRQLLVSWQLACVTCFPPPIRHVHERTVRAQTRPYLAL